MKIVVPKFRIDFDHFQRNVLRFLEPDEIEGYDTCTCQFGMLPQVVKDFWVDGQGPLSGSFLKKIPRFIDSEASQ